MSKQIFIIYLLCIHALLGFILYKSDFIERVQNKLGIRDTAQPEITEYYQRMVSFHSRMDGNVPQNAILFIGDSAIQGLGVSAIAPSSVNYGIGNDTTVGVLQRLPVYKSINKAAAIVLFIGFNDMKFRTNEAILHNISEIIQQIPNNVPVIFSSLLSPDEKVRDPNQSWKKRIHSLNEEIKTLTRTSKNLFFLDMDPLLINTQGNLKEEYHVGDGLHLNSKGNAIWIMELKKTLKNTLKLNLETS